MSLLQHAMKRLTMDLILETGGYGLKVNALSFGHCQVRCRLPLLVCLACEHAFTRGNISHHQERLLALATCTLSHVLHKAL